MCNNSTVQHRCQHAGHITKHFQLTTTKTETAKVNYMYSLSANGNLTTKLAVIGTLNDTNTKHTTTPIHAPVYC